jgi:hypothetical protein
LGTLGCGGGAEAFPDLLLEILSGKLGLEDLGDAGTPGGVEREHLGADVVLAALAVDVDAVNVTAGVGEVALEATQVGLEEVVGEEPGGAAVGVEQG